MAVGSATYSTYSTVRFQDTPDPPCPAILHVSKLSTHDDPLHPTVGPPYKTLLPIRGGPGAPPNVLARVMLP